MSAEPSADLSFEGALERLESLLAAMEDGDIPLAELVTKFAEGNQLLKACEKRLQEAELKVEKLKNMDGATAEFAPFSPDEGLS